MLYLVDHVDTLEKVHDMKSNQSDVLSYEFPRYFKVFSSCPMKVQPVLYLVQLFQR